MSEIFETVNSYAADALLGLVLLIVTMLVLVSHGDSRRRDRSAKPPTKLD